MGRAAGAARPAATVDAAAAGVDVPAGRHVVRVMGAVIVDVHAVIVDVHAVVDRRGGRGGRRATGDLDREGRGVAVADVMGAEHVAVRVRTGQLGIARVAEADLRVLEGQVEPGALVADG